MCFLDVLGEITFQTERLGANRTRPSHFQMNSLHMKVKACFARKLQSTLITCTFLIHVNGFDVLIEVTSLRKRLGTIATIEPHFLMHRLLMSAQMTCFSKRLITLITRIFLQIVMNSPDVRLKIAVSRKRFVALIALPRLQFQVHSIAMSCKIAKIVGQIHTIRTAMKNHWERNQS